MLRGPVLRAVALPVLVLNALSACYRYVPASTTDIIPGGAYRGHLSAEGSRDVARLVGENVELFDGRIITVTDSSYLIAMSATQKRADPRSLVWAGERLVIPRTAVNKFELRELDRGRTFRAALLSALGIVTIGALVFSINGGSGGDPVIVPPPTPP
jgi:hypothetical protein